MNRWTAFALLFVLTVALALRLPELDKRPLHNDEAVNAIKLAELWDHGRYKYDHDEYHGPTLHYATVPLLWLSGARSSEDFSDVRLRLAPLVCGVGLLVWLLLFWDGLGRAAVLWTALFIAISPAMVFYSRYSIHDSAGLRHGADAGRGLALRANAAGPLGCGDGRGPRADGDH